MQLNLADSAFTARCHATRWGSYGRGRRDKKNVNGVLGIPNIRRQPANAITLDTAIFFIAVHYLISVYIILHSIFWFNTANGPLYTARQRFSGCFITTGNAVANAG